MGTAVEHEAFFGCWDLGRRAGSGEEGRRPPPSALSSQGFFRLPIDHGPGRCIIHARGSEAGPRAEDAEPGQNENEAGSSA